MSLNGKIKRADSAKSERDARAREAVYFNLAPDWVKTQIHQDYNKSAKTCIICVICVPTLNLMTLTVRSASHFQPQILSRSNKLSWKWTLSNINKILSGRKI